jgi:hypothetical protein
MSHLPVHRDQIHQHPYGELNPVVPPDLDGLLRAPTIETDALSRLLIQALKAARTSGSTLA